MHFWVWSFFSASRPWHATSVAFESLTSSNKEVRVLGSSCVSGVPATPRQQSKSTLRTSKTLEWLRKQAKEFTGFNIMRGQACICIEGSHTHGCPHYQHDEYVLDGKQISNTRRFSKNASSLGDVKHCLRPKYHLRTCLGIDAHTWLPTKTWSAQWRSPGKKHNNKKIIWTCTSHLRSTLREKSSSLVRGTLIRSNKIQAVLLQVVGLADPIPSSRDWECLDAPILLTKQCSLMDQLQRGPPQSGSVTVWAWNSSSFVSSQFGRLLWRKGSSVCSTVLTKVRFWFWCRWPEEAVPTVLVSGSSSLPTLKTLTFLNKEGRRTPPRLFFSL